MPSVLKVSDPDNNNNVVETGSPTVFVNNLPIDRIGDPVSSSGVKMLTGSSFVFANGIGISRAGDTDFSTTFNKGTPPYSQNVFADSGSGPGAVVDNNPSIQNFPSISLPDNMVQPVDLDPNYVAVIPYISQASGSLFEKDDQESSAPLPPLTTPRAVIDKQTDDTPAPPPVTPVHSCPNIDLLPDDFNWINEPPTAQWLIDNTPLMTYQGYFNMHGDWFNPFKDWSNSFQLSPSFTVYQLSMHTAVSRYRFLETITQLGSGLSQKQTLSNLCYHANVILEALKTKYGSNMVVTSGFRSKTGTSQHNKGQATDIQFLNFHGAGKPTGQLYFQRAQEIRDMFDYDQIILEWFGLNPWIHVSSNSAGQRRQVLTQVAQNSYQPGLILLG